MKAIDKQEPRPSLTERLGMGGLGAMVGVAAGLVLQLAWLAVSSASRISAPFVFGCGFVGAVIGAASPTAALNALGGLLSILWGFLQGVSATWVSHDEDEPSKWPIWVVLLVVAGFMVGLAAYVSFRVP
jgi:hypothetical protein